MANQSVENVKGLLSNKRTRVVMILTFGVVVGAVIYSSMSTSNQQARPKDLAPSIVTAEAPKVVPETGTSTDPNYIDKIRKNNAELAKQAEEAGISAVPRLTKSTDREKDPFDLLAKKPPTEPKSVEPIVPQLASVVQRPVAQPAPPQFTAPQAQVQRSPGLMAAEKDMKEAMAGLLNSWSPAKQEIEVEFKPGKVTGVASDLSQGTVEGQQGAPTSQSAALAQPVQSKKASLKEGSILHAVIITSVNSDEPGPVLAQIVTGAFAGGRLIGKFETPKNSDKLTLTFNVLTMQNADRSYQFNGYAIDPETARTAIGSDVDHHYLSRYGLFTAATFLKGYATAISQQGTTQTATTGLGGVAVTTAYPTMTSEQIAITALGAVGTEIAGSLKDGLKRPATVTLNSGTEVGVLVMNDTSF